MVCGCGKNASLISAARGSCDSSAVVVSIASQSLIPEFQKGKNKHFTTQLVTKNTHKKGGG